MRPPTRRSSRRVGSHDILPRADRAERCDDFVAGLRRYRFPSASSKYAATSMRSGARGFVAWHTVSNFFYLVSARQGAAATRRFIEELMQFVDIAPTTTVHLRAASALSFKDFEYAMQVGAALACAAECIATRNARDFRRSPIPALTPAPRENAPRRRPIATQAVVACSFTPSARATFSTVAKLGFPSALRARFGLGLGLRQLLRGGLGHRRLLLKVLGVCAESHQRRRHVAANRGGHRARGGDDRRKPHM